MSPKEPYEPFVPLEADQRGDWTRPCVRCGRRPSDGARFHTGAPYDGGYYRQSKCVECSTKYQNEWKLGCTAEEQAAIMSFQKERCAVCEQPISFEKKKGACVDHDHETGMIRGILCFGCNIGIGQMREDPRIMRAAADYIERAKGISK